MELRIGFSVWAVHGVNTDTDTDTHKQTNRHTHTHTQNQPLHTWSSDLPDELTRLQLLKKFSAFYGTRRFITAFTKNRPLVSVLCQMKLIHSRTANCFQTHSNIILPSTPRLSRWSLSMGFPHQNHTPLPHRCNMPRPSHSSSFITRKIICEEYRA